jgi:hypothetical protein
MTGWFLEWPEDGRPYRGWPFTKEEPDPYHPEFEYLHDVKMEGAPLLVVLVLMLTL